MFDEPQPYTAHLRVGDHVWDVDSSTDDPDYGPLAGVRHTWQARQDDGWPTQHEPTLLVFGVIVEQGTDFDDVDQGTTVHFTFTPDGYATPLVEFGGTVRDLTGTPHERGMVYQITAVDHLQALREEYTITAFFANGSSNALLWPKLVQDAAGVGGGLGIRPALADPFTGTDAPPAGTGFFGSDVTIEGDAWTVLVGYMSIFHDRAGDTFPRFQRPILTYRLNGAGDLDPVQPYQARWAAQGYDNAPLSLVEVEPGVYGAGGGNVDACVLRTDATVWSRQRIEPNRVVAEIGFDLGTTTYLRASGSTPPYVTRETNPPAWWEGDGTDAAWILAGLDNPNQWGTEFALLGAYDPAVVAGWFTLPDAMRIAVAAYDIDPRHTPDGSGRMFGMLGGASLLIPPRGRWEVRYTTRRTLPDWDDVYWHPVFGWQDYGHGHWPTLDAITVDEFAAAYPTVTPDDLDDDLSVLDALLIGA